MEKDIDWEQYEPLLKAYYDNNAKKLHKMVDGIIVKYNGILDNDDMYSLADEIICKAIPKYNKGKGSFDGYIYSCLSKKFSSEIRNRNRYKRSNTRPKRDRIGNIIRDSDGKIEYEFVPDISLEISLGDDDGNGNLSDIIPSDYCLEAEVLEEKGEEYSDKMLKYLNRLSSVQREILHLTTAGYSIAEILHELGLTYKQYEDSNAAIHAYRNISLLL